MQYSITLHRTLFLQDWCDVLEQDRTVESSTPCGIGMLSLRNGLLQKGAFLRHNRCIELGKRYIKALASARVKQLSPGSFQTVSRGQVLVFFYRHSTRMYFMKEKQGGPI